MADGTRQLAIGVEPGKWAVVGGRDDDREVIVYVLFDGDAHEIHVPVVVEGPDRLTGRMSMRLGDAYMTGHETDA